MGQLRQMFLHLGVRLESRRSGDRSTLSWQESYLAATLLGAWRYRVIASTGQPNDCKLWLGELKSLICIVTCGMYNCLHRSIPEIHFACCQGFKQPRNNRPLYMPPHWDKNYRSKLHHSPSHSSHPMSSSSTGPMMQDVWQGSHCCSDL